MDIKNLIIQMITIYGEHNLLFLFISAVGVSYLFVALWRNYKFLSKFSFHYTGEQRVHQGEVSRWGGLMIFSVLMVFYHSIEEPVGSDYRYLLYLISPFMLISFIEDTFHDVSFLTRLVVMVLTALIINIYWIETFPVIENIPLLSYLLEFPVFATLFFSLALVGIMNGTNFIDGMNGLAALFFLGALCGCITLSMISNNPQDTATLVPWGILVACFLLFNFPSGKFFLGDSGAYLMAILLGTWLIDFFSRNQSISSWNAVLILIYPLLEVVYSTIRKTSQGKSPFHPDRCHLHIKIYDIVFTATKKPLYANNATTMFLALFWLAPAILVQFVCYSQLAIVVSILLISFSYVMINYFTPSVTAGKNI